MSSTATTAAIPIRVLLPKKLGKMGKKPSETLAGAPLKSANTIAPARPPVKSPCRACSTWMRPSSTSGRKAQARE